MAVLRTLRSGLDFMYLASGVMAALCLVAILALIVVQMLVRWSADFAKWSANQFGADGALAKSAEEFAVWSASLIPGAPDYAGYAMAAASFLAFANALNRGAHIRVSILLNAVPARVRRWLEVWCFGIGAATMWYFVWYARKFVYWSWKFNEISQGQDKTLLWQPQSLMLIGAIMLAIALTDHLIHVIFKGDHRIIRDLEDQSQGE